MTLVHEHRWQLHQAGFTEGVAAFVCDCGRVKNVKLRYENNG